jgi:hypothetical protein
MAQLQIAQGDPTDTAVAGPIAPWLRSPPFDDPGVYTGYANGGVLISCEGQLAGENQSADGIHTSGLRSSDPNNVCLRQNRGHGGTT